MEFQLPRPLSHSSISMYQECPQKYKFKYVDKIPEKPRHYFSFGKSIHTALEFFYGVKALPAPTLEQVFAHYKDKWLSEGYKDQAHEAQLFEEGKTMIAGFYKKHIEDYHIPFFVEYGFNLAVEGVPVVGFIDRVDKRPDGKLVILDYKTGKKSEQSLNSAEAQLTMYQMACEELLGAPVAETVYYHLPTLKEYRFERKGPDRVEALRGRIVSTAEGITKGQFDPKPAEKVCFWCDFKPLCPIFKHQYPAAPPAPVKADAELSVLIDRYGELILKTEELKQEAEEMKASLLKILKDKGYVRAFGKRFDLSRSTGEKWDFADKKKVLALIKKAGLYDRILAPSAPLVQQLMADPDLDPGLKAQLAEHGAKVDAGDLKIKPL